MQLFPQPIFVPSFLPRYDYITRHYMILVYISLRWPRTSPCYNLYSTKGTEWLEKELTQQCSLRRSVASVACFWRVFKGNFAKGLSRNISVKTLFQETFRWFIKLDSIIPRQIAITHEKLMKLTSGRGRISLCLQT